MDQSDPAAMRLHSHSSTQAMADSEVKIDDKEEEFWSRMKPMLREKGVTKSRIMGRPCVRQDGKFFATVDSLTKDAVFKLPAERVNELVERGEGRSFAPNGRTFKEWIAFPKIESELWEKIVMESRAFVASDAGSKAAKKRARSVKRGRQMRQSRKK